MVDIVTRLGLPITEITGSQPDLDRAADFLELAAFFSQDGRIAASKLADSISSRVEEDDDASTTEEVGAVGGEIVLRAVERIADRQHVLGASYPFSVEQHGMDIHFAIVEGSLGQIAYILCLILSDISASFPALEGELHPNEEDKRKLRQYFQFFATAALAAEIKGSAWSFGFPRPDHSGFIAKLTEIWKVIDDGSIEPQEGASKHPKDDKIDVLAARVQNDRLPGFLFAAAQVTTGREIGGKSLRGHLSVFKSRWFHTQPVTEMIPYMIVPFVFSREKFVDCVRVVGNLLHRLRIPIRVSEAEELVQSGVVIEGYNFLNSASKWLLSYRSKFL